MTEGIKKAKKLYDKIEKLCKEQNIEFGRLTEDRDINPDYRWITVMLIYNTIELYFNIDWLTQEIDEKSVEGVTIDKYNTEEAGCINIEYITKLLTFFKELPSKLNS